MKFCPTCNNLFYNKIEEDNLIFYCKHCNYSRNFDPEIDSREIYHSDYSNNTISYREKINKYTHLDPTLPRVNNIDCPNELCKSHEDESIKEVIYIKYDTDQMNFIYLCCNCHTKWKSDEK